MIRQMIVIVGLACTVALLANCSKNDVATPNISSLQALPIVVTTPMDNPQTVQKINLGRMLFWDPVLSGGRDVACASCHHSSLGYSDNLDLAIGSNGVGLGTTRHFNFPNNIAFSKRNTPTIINVAFNGIDQNNTCNPASAVMFFDNRVLSLEVQCLQPIKTLEEMKGSHFSTETVLDSVIARLKVIPGYVQLFSAAFGSDSITTTNLAKAIACFERTIISNNSPYDQYVRGNSSAMTNLQIQGLKAFQDNGCNNCHIGAMFSDYQLHVLSVPDNPKLPTDAGANSSYAFRTPSLRNLALTYPYMHSGVFNSIGQVLDFYDQIGDGHSQNSHVANNRIDAKIKRINNRDKAAITEFLNALNDFGFDKTVPASVPSGLRVGGNL